MLYKSASGREVNHGSSSSLDTFRLCRRKFKLSRIDGWKQKARKASLEIGKCLEAALQYYHENGCKEDDFEMEWSRLWLKFADIELVYTDQEGSWQSIYNLGKQWAKLYQITLPTLPIKNPKFQLSYQKPLWPGDPNYGELEFYGIIDLLSTLENGERIVVDIKTAKSRLPIATDMMSLDGQLRKYAWVSGIREVAFLNFVKCDPDSFRKGVDVTLLEDTRDWQAGSELVVAKYSAAKDDSPEMILLGSWKTVQIMDAELDLISGKGTKERTEALFAAYLADGRLFAVPRSALTKAKLQFVRGTIPEEDLPDIGNQIGQDMFAIKRTAETNSFFKDGGVRFPNAVCSWCEMRGICTGNQALVEELLVQIKPKPTETVKDWLDELESEESE